MKSYSTSRIETYAKNSYYLLIIPLILSISGIISLALGFDGQFTSMLILSAILTFSTSLITKKHFTDALKIKDIQKRSQDVMKTQLNLSLFEGAPLVMIAFAFLLRSDEVFASASMTSLIITTLISTVFALYMLRKKALFY